MTVLSEARGCRRQRDAQRAGAREQVHHSNGGAIEVVKLCNLTTKMWQSKHHSTLVLMTFPVFATMNTQFLK
jgi:hypothetical protein